MDLCTLTFRNNNKSAPWRWDARRREGVSRLELARVRTSVLSLSSPSCFLAHFRMLGVLVERYSRWATQAKRQGLREGDNQVQNQAG